MHAPSAGSVRRLIHGPRPLSLYVDGGMVHCPRQGDIEMDACFDCPDFKRLRHDGALAVQCTPATSYRFDPTPFSWYKPFDPSK